MKPYPHECNVDYIEELINYTERQLHEAGECKGAPECGWCLDAQERGEESSGG